MEVSVKFKKDFEVDGEISHVREVFTNLDNIAACYGDVERVEKVDAETLEILMRSQKVFGRTFQGTHRCRFDQRGEGFVWQSVPAFGNMHAVGRLGFDASSPGCTRVVFEETMAIEIPASGWLLKAVTPLVQHSVRSAMEAYLAKMSKRV